MWINSVSRSCRPTSPLTTAVLDRIDGAGLAGFLDSVGGHVLAAMLPALRPGGTIVSYGVLDNTPGVRNFDLIYRYIAWKGYGIDHWLATARHGRDEMERELWSLIRAGDIALPIRDRYPLADIEAAVAAAAGKADSGEDVVATTRRSPRRPDGRTPRTHPARPARRRRYRRVRSRASYRYSREQPHQ